MNSIVKRSHNNNQLSIIDNQLQRLFPFLVLAQSFLRPQGFLMNISIPFLARNFGSSARLLPWLLPESYSCTSPIRQRQVTQQLTKIAAKNKTKPFQSHSKPFFGTSNPILSKIMRIFEDFRQTFLCKTKPFFSKIQIKNKGLTTVSQSKCGSSLKTKYWVSGQFNLYLILSP